jgi:two-component system, OmpR family, response regulator
MIMFASLSARVSCSRVSAPYLGALLQGSLLSRSQDKRDVLRFGGWVIDRRTRRLTNASGANVSLTKGEYTLLSTFPDAPGRPLTREHLLQATHAYEDIFNRSIDVQVLRFRRKLESYPNAPSIILTEPTVERV